MESKFDVKPLEKWFPDLQLPLIIAGPCSVEGEEQVLETVKQITEQTNEVSIIRGGIWKPRTRPNSFEGIGEIGLPWIKNAGRAVGLPVATEVANAQHVELALKNEIDVLWIGAHYTVSPFNVQDIADALRGVSIPVMIKNPVNPDVELWFGAVERIHAAGISRIAAIHRGFSSYEKTIYRNPPMWEIPIELRRRFPEIPIIVDPSHISGSRSLIYTLAQQGLDMGFEGLMIETHVNPDKAWSNAKQQITPARLGEILDSLVMRQNKIPDNHLNGLQDLSARVDRIDDYIIELLCERMGISEEIGELKKEQHLAIHQADRWAEIVKRALEKGKTGGLSEQFILKFFQQIHNESIYHQNKVMEQV